MSNHLSNESSPYLLQHAQNPVDWYPWDEEAFAKAQREDKPIFLSIGYSTCHWCHVMAHESFEDAETAAILNAHYVAVKVDKEERPDIDSVYMAVCQALTGSGGWPMSIFMTPAQMPFFAGTYFPKIARYASPGFRELLLLFHDKWQHERTRLLRAADEIVSALRQAPDDAARPSAEKDLIETALSQYKSSFDEKNGGFGGAPKFPAPQNLLFLLQQYEKHGDQDALHIAERTLLQMYRGGLFDHIGYGFCRYSTDRFFLVPHFEKMLYDNALLILAYCKAFELTQNALYRDVAQKTASYVLSEMLSPDGGFFSAQDADSDGVEGKYYVFTPDEITSLLGDADGTAFNACFDITPHGNFEGKSIPNLLHTQASPAAFDPFLPALRNYRKQRAALHTDDKILLSWNALMIAALCALYRVSRDAAYLDAAKRTEQCIQSALCEKDTLYVAYRDGKRGGKGFLDDYATYAFALLSLYDATLEENYLVSARRIAARAVTSFFDAARGGFYLYGTDNESLFLRPKESYDGALPSGNSMMAYLLVRLRFHFPDAETEAVLQRQLDFLAGEAARYPTGYAMFLMALSDFQEPPVQITAVGHGDALATLPLILPLGGFVRVLSEETSAYKQLGGQSTFYVCSGHACLPPVNVLTKEYLSAST